MSNEFLEELLSIQVRYGATYSDKLNVEITETVGGQESRRLLNPIPTRYFNLGYVSSDTEIGARVLNLYHRVFGKFAGFLVQCWDDYTTASDGTTAPTNTDQELLLVSTGIYQLQKEYGADSAGLAIGYPTRTIYKPIVNTTVVSIVNSSTTYPQTVTTHWTVSTTTGRVTFAANKTKAITGITLGATTLITFGSAHTFLVGDSVHFSGIVGTTELNNKRGTITAINTAGDNITVSINSSAYTAWASGGTVNTRPQTGDTVKGGCEFYIPCRFNSDLDIEATDYGIRSTNPLEIKELITL